MWRGSVRTVLGSLILAAALASVVRGQVPPEQLRQEIESLKRGQQEILCKIGEIRAWPFEAEIDRALGEAEAR